LSSLNNFQIKKEKHLSVLPADAFFTAACAYSTCQWKTLWQLLYL